MPLKPDVPLPTLEEKIRDVFELISQDIEENNLGAQESLIAKRIAATVQRLIQRHKWPYHLTAMAMMALTNTMFETIYDRGEADGDKS